MRSLATISRRARPPSSPRPYSSRTFPLAIRGNSASALMAGKISAPAGEPGAGRSRGSGDLIQTREDLLRVADEVAVVEDRVQIQTRGARIGGQQILQRHAGIEGPLGELLGDP